MKKHKKNKSKSAKLYLKENIIVTENISSNFLKLSNTEFHLNSFMLNIHALEAGIEEIKNNIDSMSELNETESLRLQMAMDRMSKFETALSNIIKKINETQETIIQNLKG